MSVSVSWLPVLFLVLALFGVLVFSSDTMDLLYVLLAVEMVVYMVSATKSWSHVIMLMLVLEFFSIGGFIAASTLSITTMGPLMVFLFAVVMVCEASVGMGLIVSLTRGRGDEMVSV